MHTGEAVVAVGIAGLATAISAGSLQVPEHLLQSSVTQTFLLIMALVLFAYSPVVGIAAIGLFAVMLYNRNIQKTSFYQKAAAARYGEEGIAREHVGGVREASGMTDQPRDYSKFAQDTAEGYQATPVQAMGQFPLNEPRPYSDPQQDSYMYRPGPDMGSDAFDRFGPQLDHKMASFAY